MTTGCITAPQMAVPPELAEGELLEVQGRSMVTSDFGRQRFTVGTYAVTGARSSTDRNRETVDDRAYATTTVEREESTEFEVADGEEVLAGRCEMASATTSQETIIRGMDDTSQVGATVCSCGESSLTMPVGDDSLPGTLELGEATHRVLAQFSNTQGFNTFDPTGYIVESADGAPLAGVSVVHPGAIWLANAELDSQQRHELICLLTGAMLRAGERSF
jgi:hypothetical protein